LTSPAQLALWPGTFRHSSLPLVSRSIKLDKSPNPASVCKTGEKDGLALVQALQYTK